MSYKKVIARIEAYTFIAATLCHSFSFVMYCLSCVIFFHVRPVCFFSPSIALSPQDCCCRKSLSDNEVDGILANIYESLLTPPSSPPVSFTPSRAISESRRIVCSRRENSICVTQHQLKKIKTG